MTKNEHSTHSSSFSSSSSKTEHSGRVLVVDDNDPVRHLLRLELQTAGFEVLEAATQLDLQRRLATTRPDALLLDLQQSAEGYGLLIRMRARQTLRDVPIVYLAAFEDDDFRQQTLRAGADWFGSRPLAMVELRTRLRDLIRNGRSASRLLADHNVGQLAWHDDNPLNRPRRYVRLNAG
jgi:DNA-binding response OmpR family regulator